MIKTINLITVPYDSAHFNKRMGTGPLHFINSGLIDKLKSSGHDVKYKQVTLEEEFPTEIASTMQLLHQIKSEVTVSIQNALFPIILSGNCLATVAVVAGLNEDHLGVIWFDAHGDCETPETTASGFLDGMGLSMLTYNCWQNILSSFNMRSSISGKDIILLGARDLSKHEKNFISTNGINYITVDQIKNSRERVIESAFFKLIENGIQKLHIHVDADVIDPSIAPANSYSAINGLSKEDLFETIKLFTDKIPITSLTIASYDPLFDIEDRMLTMLYELIQTITE